MESILYNASMRYRLRTLLVPRRIARLRFTFYELVGLISIAAISLAIGTSFLHDSLAVSLGIIGASLFNAIACYTVGIGIGRCSGRRKLFSGNAKAKCKPRFCR